MRALLIIFVSILFVYQSLASTSYEVKHEIVLENANFSTFGGFGLNIGSDSFYKSMPFFKDLPIEIDKSSFEGFQSGLSQASEAFVNRKWESVFYSDFLRANFLIGNQDGSPDLLELNKVNKVFFDLQNLNFAMNPKDGKSRQVNTHVDLTFEVTSAYSLEFEDKTFNTYGGLFDSRTCSLGISQQISAKIKDISIDRAIDQIRLEDEALVDTPWSKEREEAHLNLAVKQARALVLHKEIQNSPIKDFDFYYERHGQAFNSPLRYIAQSVRIENPSQVLQVDLAQFEEQCSKLEAMAN